MLNAKTFKAQICLLYACSPRCCRAHEVILLEEYSAIIFLPAVVAGFESGKSKDWYRAYFKV